MHQLNRAPAANAEESLKHGAVDYGRIHRDQLLANLCKPQ
jgi:hypothetical protein